MGCLTWVMKQIESVKFGACFLLPERDCNDNDNEWSAKFED